MKNLFIILSIIISQSLFSQNYQSFDCFSILVGKDASFDGSVLLAHNEDDWGERVVNILKVNQKFDVEEVAELKNGGLLKLGDWQNEILWIEMPEMEFSDTYMNEYGVTIVSDACLSKEDKPTLTDGGIGYWLRRTMALKARSAREAVKIGGNLIDIYGYASSGRTYVIADANEAWMLSVVNGKHWVAQKVPDDEIAIIPNYYTISNVDLSDTINFYGSKDLIEYAVARGWYNPDLKVEFSFRDAYSHEENLSNPENKNRHWRSINMLSAEKFGRDDNFPFSFKPNEGVELTDLFAILRDHYENTDLDLSENYLLGDPHHTQRGICCISTQYGLVAQLRSNMPKEIGNLMWLSIFRPCIHAFLPWYFGISSAPTNFSKFEAEDLLNNHFNKIEDINNYKPDLYYFDFYNHALQIDNDYGTVIPLIQYENFMLESKLTESQESFEMEMSSLLKENESEGINQITDFVNQQILLYLKTMEK